MKKILKKKNFNGGGIKEMRKDRATHHYKTPLVLLGICFLFILFFSISDEQDGERDKIIPLSQSQILSSVHDSEEEMSIIDPSPTRKVVNTLSSDAMDQKNVNSAGIKFSGNDLENKKLNSILQRVISLNQNSRGDQYSYQEKLFSAHTKEITQQKLKDEKMQKARETIQKIIEVKKQRMAQINAEYGLKIPSNSSFSGNEENEHTQAKE